MKRGVPSILALVPALATLGCKTASPSSDTPDPRESPQASAEPAPLAVVPTTTQSATVSMSPEGGPPPVPLRGDERLAADAAPRESSGYTLSAAFRLADLTGPPRAPEVNAAGVEAARKATDLRVHVDLTSSRMRAVLQGRGYALPPETEIRARADRYGHVVVWPGAATYRPLGPGSLRALLGERRFDVAPITRAELVTRDEVGRRIGIYVRKVEVSTRAAKAVFEIGKLEGAGEGGVLLCRMLLDLMNAPPSSALCASDEVPVRAELKWTSHGSLGFELTGVLRRTDIPAAPMLVPPPSASFASAPLPVAGVASLLTAQELAALRTGPVDVPSSAATAGDDLVVANSTVQLRMLFIDGVPAAWAAPGARDPLPGLHRGRYVVQWRTFLGDAVEPPVTQTVPGLAQIGGADAGVR